MLTGNRAPDYARASSSASRRRGYNRANARKFRPFTKKGEDMSSVKSTEKWRAVETALTQIERQFGKGSIMRLGDQPETVIAVIPTGSLAGDAALGWGSSPPGPVAVIFGPGSSAKTTLSA